MKGENNEKAISVLIVSMLLLSVFCPAAFATEPQYANTKAFTNGLDKADLIYAVRGIDDDGDEHVTVGFTDNDKSYTVHFFFDEDNEYLGIRIWDILTYSDADFSRLLRVINTLNDKYKYVNFTLDESDNTVSLSFDLILRPSNSVEEITLEALLRVVQILKDSLETLTVYER